MTSRPYRRPYRPARPTPVWVPVVVIVAVVVILTGIGWAVYDRAQGDKRAREVLNSQVAAVHAKAANDEMMFWLREGVHPNDLEPLKKAVDALTAESNRRSDEVDRKWGREVPGYDKLKPSRAVDWDAFLTGADKVTKQNLRSGSELLQAELNSVRSKIHAAVMPKLILEGSFDRTTAAGEQAHRDRMRMLPIERDAERARVDLVRAERYAAAAPKVVEKHVARVREQNRQAIAELEAALSAAP